MTDGRPRRILLVEDDVPFRELLQAFLEASGYEVITAGNGREAARLVRQGGIDAIVSDLCMPDHDGMELLMELRTEAAPPPVLVMSGGVGGRMAGMLRMAELLGAERTLAKPFPLRLLADMVRDVLAERPCGCAAG